jgi:hypothetical protein
MRLKPPSFSLDTVSNVRAWLAARRIIGSFGLRFFRRIQLMAGASLLAASAYASVAIAILLLSNSSGLGLIAQITVAAHAGLTVGGVAALLFIMLGGGAEANKQSDEHAALLAARKLEALQAMSAYTDPVALAHADVARDVGNGSGGGDGGGGADSGGGTEGAPPAQQRQQRRQQQQEQQRERLAARIDAYLGVGTDAAGQRARGLAAARAARWRAVAEVLDSVAAAVAHDRRLEPLTILSFECSEALASSLLGAAGGLEVGLIKVLNDKFSILGGVLSSISGP